ncbi:hypothetical protein DWUX_2403 [Desulfovibrio diazotrophicus]|nr:hypothetical protein DWUX_2403 [Desulfovibrio diazotrophicus]
MRSNELTACGSAHHTVQATPDGVGGLANPQFWSILLLLCGRLAG